MRGDRHSPHRIGVGLSGWTIQGVVCICCLSALIVGANANGGYVAAGNQLCFTDENGAISQITYDGENRISKMTVLNADTPYVNYLYDANGNRIQKSNQAGSYTEYIYFGGEPLAERNNDGTWSDYIFANGKRIARADNFDVRIHLSGTTCNGCPAESTFAGTFAGTGSLTALNGYTVRPGDKLSWRQYQAGSASGGINISFAGGTDADGAPDQDGAQMNADTTMNRWHLRTVDLTAYAGKTISGGALWNFSETPPGNWDIYFADIALTASDGSVIPVYNRGQGIVSPSFAGAAESNFTAMTEDVANASDPTTPNSQTATTFYLGDHLGSTSMLVSAGGWSLVSNRFMPFGAQTNTDITANHYKFTGKERDQESGLDYFGARYYASNMGRWMSPDWSSNPISIPFARIDNPQTLTLYAYVGNNPLRRFDSNGHLDCSGGALQDVACAVTAAAKSIWNWLSGGSNSQSTSVTTTQQDNYTPEQMGQQNVFTAMRPNRAPDFYSASLQLGYTAPSVSYMPSTKNVFAGPGAAGPHGFGLMLTAGWSKRPEDFLGGSSASGCAYFVAAACVGSSLTSFAPTLQLGVNIGPPGGSLSAGYNLDWNSYTQSLYESLPVEAPGAVGVGSGLYYNPCADDFNCQ